MKRFDVTRDNETALDVAEQWMQIWIRRHSVVAALLWAALTLAATAGVLVIYYLNSWLTLPLP